MKEYQVFYINDVGDFTSRIMYGETPMEALTEFNDFGGCREVLGLIKI